MGIRFATSLKQHLSSITLDPLLISQILKPSCDKGIERAARSVIFRKALSTPEEILPPLHCSHALFQKDYETKH